MPDSWSLYIDESGRFEASAFSIVGGVLLGGSVADVARSALRQRIEEIWSPGRFPPHASTQMVASARAAIQYWLDGKQGRRGLMSGGRFEGELRGPSRELAESAQRHGNAVARRGFREIDERGYPSFEACQAIESWAQPRQSPAYQVLAAIRDRQAAAMWKLFDRTANRRGGGFAFSAIYAAPLVDQPEEPDVSVPLQLDADAYVLTLRACLRRVAMLVGPASVEVVVLTRRVSAGGQYGWPMQSHFVEQLCDDACRGLPAPPRFVPRGITNVFDPRWTDGDEPGDGSGPREVHAGSVLADWAANRVASAISARWQDWPGARLALAKMGVLRPGYKGEHPSPAPVPGVALPGIAWVGDPEAIVEGGLASQPPPPPFWWGDDQAAILARHALTGGWR